MSAISAGIAPYAGLTVSMGTIYSLPDELFALPKLKSVALYRNLFDKAYVERLRARYPRITFYT